MSAIGVSNIGAALKNGKYRIIGIKNRMSLSRNNGQYGVILMKIVNYRISEHMWKKMTSIGFKFPKYRTFFKSLVWQKEEQQPSELAGKNWYTLFYKHYLYNHREPQDSIEKWSNTYISTTQDQHLIHMPFFQFHFEAITIRRNRWAPRDMMYSSLGIFLIHKSLPGKNLIILQEHD